MPGGYPVSVEWDWNSSTNQDYYKVTFLDRTQWILVPTGSGWYDLQSLADRNGNLIKFNYTIPLHQPNPTPLISSITDSNNKVLLTVNRTSYTITSVSDCYGRSVYYHIGSYTSNTVTWNEVDHVSQVVATGTSNPPDRYAYGYTNINNGEGTEQVPFMTSITVPSPTGTGNATAIINYSPNTDYVSSTVDANGNTRTYTIVDQSHTKVAVTDAHSNLVYSYTVGFDNNMNKETVTDGTNSTLVYSATYADPNDPYRASLVQDGNGYANGGGAGTLGTWAYTWDSFGNVLTRETPYGTVTTYTTSYSNFSLGEVTKIQVGSKTPTTLSYYEPSGLLQSITYAKSGDTSGATVTANFTYDTLGNLTQESGPGNNATQTETVSFNYTSDPTYNYTQAEALYQPLTRTDTLGHVAHFRFDSRGNKTTEIDAAGNEMDLTWNLANQLSTITFPAAGMTGSGRAQVDYTYLYAGGPKTQETQYNESGVQSFQIVYGYGPEGEALSRSGSTQPFTATYDALYRTTSLADGDSHLTTYSYTTAGYLGTVSYPDANVNTGYDILAFKSFDKNGNVLQRVDGRGVVTNFVYNDPESKLTDLQYPATPAINVHIDYDAYGRRQDRSDGSGSQSWSYDFNDMLLTATTTYTGLPAQTLTCAYYPDGSRQTLTLPDSTSFSYSYDSADRWTGLTNPSNQSWSWTYLNNDWLSQQTDGSLITVNYTRNARGIVTALLNKKTSGGSTLSSYSVNSFTSAGSIAQVVSSIPAASTLGGTTSYTQNSQLEETQESSTVNGGYTLTCGYDAAENPTTFRGVAQTFNADNQNSAYTWDGNGNPTTYRGSSLSFDAENRLTAFGSTLTAGYRGDGLRAWKTTYFIYDVDLPVLELNGSGTKLAVTTFGPTGALARTTSTRTLFYTSDYLGDVSQQLNASTGSVVASYAFDSFGARSYHSSDGSATSDPYAGFGGVMGYYTDWETGLQLLGHRYYDSATGRFLNRDPMDTLGGINLYGYACNNPLDLCDPDGYAPAGPGDGGNGHGGGGHGGSGGGTGNIGWPKRGGGGAGSGTGDGGGGDSPGAGAGAGCLAGGIGAAIGKLISGGIGGLFNASAICPILMACGTGAVCGALGTLVGAGVAGCIVGAVCGAMSSTLGLLCSAFFCSQQPGSGNILCQFGSGIASGCLGGFIPGPIGGWIGGIGGGIVGGLCDKFLQ